MYIPQYANLAFDYPSTAGEDFSANAVTPRTFQFPRGSSSGREICTVFTAFQDSVPEPEPESVTLVLEAFDIAVVIPQDTVTFTIIDDDGECAV